MNDPNADEQILPHEPDTQTIVEQLERRKPYQPYLEASLGLRNHWYAALFGQELAEGAVRGEMILGERIVFKRANGTVYALADRCPHRGAPLSARPECYSTNTVTCWLHGFTFDVRDGTLVQIITDPESKLIGKHRHKTYPVRELNGVVFVYIGDGEPAPIEEDIQPMFLQPGLAFHPVSRNRARGNWRIAAENGYDAAHIYGHRAAGLFQAANVAVPLGTFPSRKEAVTVTEGERGPWGITKADDVNIWEVEVEGVKVRAANVDLNAGPPAYEITVGLFMPCGLQVTHFPAPKMLHFEWYTPVDDDHHLYIILHAASAQTPADAARFHADCERLWAPIVWQQPRGQSDRTGDGINWGFNNFDAYGRAQIHHAYQYEDYWHKELLFRPDYIIVRWRMLVSRHLRGVQRWGEWAHPRGWSPDGRNYDPGMGPTHAPDSN
jgi:carbazole 1,9a-dioxygenase terminal dioxygenase component